MNVFEIIFIIISFLFFFWHAKKLFSQLFKKKYSRWYHLFSIITRIIFLLVIINGLILMPSLEENLQRLSWIELIVIILMDYLLLAWIQNNIFLHLARRKPLEMSIAPPQFGGGEPRTKLNISYHHGAPSLEKSSVNLFLFICYATVIVYSFYTNAGYGIIAFAFHGFLIFLSYLIKTDIFSPSEKESDYIL